MKTIREQMEIENIPAVLWGEGNGALYIALHGDMSHKEDAAIAVFAEEATQKGYRVLSCDLPEHGERKGEARLCNPQNATEDLQKILAYAQGIASDIGLFGCSIGAYFGMLAYAGTPLRQALFLSPVTDMRRIIENMMMWFDISPEQLKSEKVMATPIKTLYWDYYRYVVENPVKWKAPTALLYGAKDAVCEYDYVRGFAEKIGADMTVYEEGEHYFHTQSQLAFFQQWLRDKIHAH